MNTPQSTFRFEPEIKAKLIKIAREKNISLADVLRELINECYAKLFPPY